jgi:lysophospholipase L1-like esterase
MGERMKTIVCFGDSNTWGADPAGSGRLAPDVRWTGVLGAQLGADYRIIEEGLNGRTTTVDDPIYPYLNGLSYLPACLASHAPFDLITIMLGTNDLKVRFNRTASDIAESAAYLAQVAARSASGIGGKPPEVLLIAPPAVTTLDKYGEMFDGAIEKSNTFPRYYEALAGWEPVEFFDAGSVIRCSDLDGIHFDAAEHGKLGAAVAVKIRSILA